MVGQVGMMKTSVRLMFTDLRNHRLKTEFYTVLRLLLYCPTIRDTVLRLPQEGVCAFFRKVCKHRKTPYNCYLRYQAETCVRELNLLIDKDLIKKKPSFDIVSKPDFKYAQEKTRTSIPLTELGPEPSASTNSATWAFRLSADSP